MKGVIDSYLFFRDKVIGLIPGFTWQTPSLIVSGLSGTGTRAVSVSASGAFGVAVTPTITERTNSASVGAGAGASVTAACNAGEIVTGGGFRHSSVASTLITTVSAPSGNGWEINLRNTSAGSETATAYALCMTVPI